MELDCSEGYSKGGNVFSINLASNASEIYKYIDHLKTLSLADIHNKVKTFEALQISLEGICRGYSSNSLCTGEGNAQF